MHTLLSAFFAMLYSFSHTAQPPAAQPPLEALPYTQTLPAADHASLRIATPRLYHSASYAGTACVSCRRTNISYRAH